VEENCNESVLQLRGKETDSLWRV